MSETSIVALFVAGGVFLVLIITLVKYNVDAAIKMWGVLGVLLAAITSHYFTDQSNKVYIAKLQDSNKAIKLALNNAKVKAAYVNEIVSPFATSLKGEKGMIWKVVKSKNERKKFISEFNSASNKLQEIGSIDVTSLDNL